MRGKRGAAALLLAVTGVAFGGRPMQAVVPPQRAFDVEALLDLRHPSSPEWSPDGDRIAFLWRDGAAVGLWLVDARDDAEPELVDAGDDGRPVQSFTWAPDGSALAWSDGDLHLRTMSASGDPVRERRLTDTEAAESLPTFAPDGASLLFAREGEIRRLDLDPGDESTVRGETTAWDDATTEAERTTPGEGTLLSVLDLEVLALRVAPDGSWLAVLARRTETKEVDASPLVGDRLAYRRQQAGSPDLALVPAGQTGGAGRDPLWLERGPARSGSVSWSHDGRLAWQEVSPDARTRRVVVAAGAGWEPAVRFEETDAAWWSLTWLDAGPRWEPGGDRVAFLSDRDGWCHLYVLEVPKASAPVADGGEAPEGSPEPVQLTSGRWEVEEPDWHPEGGRLVVAANRSSATERSLWLVPATTEGGNDREIDEAEPLSRLRGTSTRPRWSPDGETILFLHSDPERPLDLWRQPPRDAPAVQLTDSWPEDVSTEELVEPVVVRFMGADGELVPGLLLAPLDPGEEPGPGLVWVHGGGVRQNRWGWPPLRGDAMFYGLNQLLVQRGYTVLAVDYRGSIGYGRGFRVAHHRDLGGIDLDDVLAAGRYLTRLDRPGVGKVGAWGRSYGGYLALHALVSAPPAFDAVVDVAGVADWSAWVRDPGGPWIVGRLGDPEEVPDLYRARSPIHGVGRIIRPLLVLHGTDDRAVPVLQTVRLVDALVEAGRPFESMIYPGETHVFSRRATWRDAFGRVERFLDRHLRN